METIKNNMQNSWLTNTIGASLIFMAFMGNVSRWWFGYAEIIPRVEVVTVFIAGAVFVGGMSDEFLSDIRKKFNNKKDSNEKPII